CGRPSISPLAEDTDRIYGGSEAVPGSWPWQAQLKQGVFGHTCGGALISDQHVLTAAHCLWGTWPSQLKIHLGSHQRVAREATEISVGVEEICMHPGAHQGVPSGLMQDIAIIKLKSKVNPTRTIQPVCLPENAEELPKNAKVFVVGWGETRRESSSSVLKQAAVTSISNEQCRALGKNIIPQFFCGRHLYGSACRGDSGGSIVHRRNGTWSLHGIVSGGPAECGTASMPQIFVKVSSFVDNFIAPYLDPKTTSQKRNKICRLYSL
ncbi:unnamed protein product, partial [Ixodes hexagonus]